MSAIIDIKAREILDSRGNPTVEADVVLELLRRRSSSGSIRSLNWGSRGGRAPRWRRSLQRKRCTNGSQCGQYRNLRSALRYGWLNNNVSTT